MVLHGAEHSSKLGRVMAAQTTADVTYVLRQPDDGGIRFPEDACDSRDNHVTVRATRTKTLDATTAHNLTDGQWGVSDPCVSALGRSRRAKGEGRSRPRVVH